MKNYLNTDDEIMMEIANQAISSANIKYGIIFIITSFILSVIIWCLYHAYKDFSMDDIESKIFINIFALFGSAIPIYWWAKSLIYIILANCYTQYYLYIELGGFN